MRKRPVSSGQSSESRILSREEGVQVQVWKGRKEKVAIIKAEMTRAGTVATEWKGSMKKHSLCQPRACPDLLNSLKYFRPSGMGYTFSFFHKRTANNKF